MDNSVSKKTVRHSSPRRRVPVSPRPMSFALIGTGGIAQTYAQAFQTTDVCKLTAVADIDRASAVAFAEPLGASAYDDYRTLADEADFDAVIVSTPPNSHPEIAIYFMERGKHVLCEKPLCLSTADAERMLEVSKARGVTFTMASKFRYVADVVKAKSLLASGVLGEVIQFENAFTAKVDMSTRWNSDSAIGGGGVLIDYGTHSVDIIRYFLGPITEVLAVDAGATQRLSVDENVMMFAKTRNKITARVDLTWGINKELPNFISLYGTRGTLHVGWRESKYKTDSNPNWTVFGNGYDKVQAFRSKLENFREAIYGSDELLITPEDALASVQVISAAYKSVSQDLWQRVEEKALKVEGR